MSVDNLHPTVRGYQIWADALKPIFTEILGRPRRRIRRRRRPVTRARDVRDRSAIFRRGSRGA